MNTVFVTRDHHSLLWSKATIFEKYDAYCCGRSGAVWRRRALRRQRREAAAAALSWVLALVIAVLRRRRRASAGHR